MVNHLDKKSRSILIHDLDLRDNEEGSFNFNFKNTTRDLLLWKELTTAGSTGIIGWLELWVWVKLSLPMTYNCQQTNWWKWTLYILEDNEWLTFNICWVKLWWIIKLIKSQVNYVDPESLGGLESEAKDRICEKILQLDWGRCGSLGYLQIQKQPKALLRATHLTRRCVVFPI